MDFEKAVDLIIELEGGYVNDPSDPGGETKYGISKRSYPDEDIKNMTKGLAKHLYERDYWMKLKCPGLPALHRLAVFDAAVNQGPRAAAIDYQRALKIKADGIVGNETLNTARYEDPKEILVRYLQNRVLRYFRTNNFDKYGRGWINRLVHIAVESKE